MTNALMMYLGLGLTLGGGLLMPRLARAEQRYVDAAAAAAGNGRAGAPWATLQEAADHVEPGDTVHVAAGRYVGFALSTSGEPTARIAFLAEQGVIIDRPSDSDETGIYLHNVSHVTVSGFRVEGVAGRGLAHRGATATEPVTDLVISGNTIVDAGREGMYLSQVSESRIEGNTIRGAGASGEQRTHGIYLANGGSDNTDIIGNHISFSGTAGIHFNGDLSIGGDGLIRGLRVEGNIIHDNGQNGLNMDGVQDSRVVNNVIYANTLNGIRAYTIDAAAGPGNLHIVNNTIAVPAGAGWCVRVTDVEQPIVIFNNILMNASGSNGSVALDGTGQVSSNHNVVVDAFTPDRDDSYLDLAQWQGLGFDLDSLVSTPEALFVDAATGDYRLRAGSTAIDRGQQTFESVQAPDRDVSGQARPVGTSPDVGAYEACNGDDCAPALRPDPPIDGDAGADAGTDAAAGADAETGTGMQGIEAGAGDSSATPNGKPDATTPADDSGKGKDARETAGGGCRVTSGDSAPGCALLVGMLALLWRPRRVGRSLSRHGA